jgi:hypothetical protein
VGTAAAVSLLATVDRLPAEFVMARYRLVSSWPVSAIVWVTAASLAVSWLRVPCQQAVRRATVAVSLAAFAGMSTAASLSSTADVDDLFRAARTVDALADQLETSLDPDLEYIVRPAGVYAALHRTSGLLRELRRRGFDARVEPDDPYIGTTHGNDDPDAVLTVIDGVALSGTEVGRLLAYVEGSTERELQRVEALRRGVVTRLRDDAVVTAAGREEIERRGPASGVLADVAAGDIDGRSTEWLRDVVLAVLDGLVEMPDDLLDDVARLGNALGELIARRTYVSLDVPDTGTIVTPP